MAARSVPRALSASILLCLALAGTAAAAPPADSTDSRVDPFLLESDYAWSSDTSSYGTFDGEPRTASNPAPVHGDCGSTEMTRTSWWQIRGTGRHTFITTSQDSTDTNYDTVLAVYEEGVGGSIGAFVDCNDDVDVPDDLGSTVDLDTTDPSKDYLIQVGAVGGTGGNLNIFASTDVPGNDGRANAQALAVAPQTFWENFGATPVNVDENCSGGGGGTEAKTVWFKYTSPERGNVAFDVAGGFNLIAGVYRGDSGAALACGNNFGTTTAHVQSGDQDKDTYFLQVGAADDSDDYFADGFDADESFFGVEVRFMPDPDDDDDGVLDGQDRCPLVKGSGLVNDCPDGDRDGVADGIQDKCGGLNPTSVGRADKNSDGCPDTLLLHKRIDLSRSVLLARGGIILQFFKVKGVPAGAAVKVVCKKPDRRRCGGLSVKRASTANARAKAARTLTAKIAKRLPFGTQITTKVTAPYATGSLIRFTAARNSKGFRQQRFCMNYGSSKLRPASKGCQ
jgi:hypothetical protein